MEKTQTMTLSKLFVVGAAMAALGVAAAGAAPMPALAQSAAEKSAIDAAKAAGTVGEQADGFLGVRGSVSGEVQAAVAATNAARREAYARRGAQAGTTAEVAGARMFETLLLPRVASGEWYRNAQRQWVQK